MTKTRLILTIFPKFFWIALAFGLLFRFIGGEYYIISNIIINFLLIFISIKAGVIIHEIGHLVFAKIVGGQPRRLVLGNGHEILRFKLLKIKIIVNSPFRGGFAFATFPNQNLLKLRYLFYVSGGFLFNILFAYCVYFFTGLNLDSFSGEYGIDIGTAFIVSNVFLIIITLIPFPVNYMGIKMSNDGLNILKLPFIKREKISKEINTNELLDAFDYFETKEYDKAIEIYERYLKYDEIQTIIKINLSVMYLKKGEYSKALDILLETVDSIDNKQNKKYKALVYNNIAWIYLITGEIEKADSYSEKAFNLVPKEKSFQGTRGSVLIEKGEIDNGVSMLADLVDFKFINSQTMTAAMYLGFGYFLKKNTKKQNKYLNFVENNIDKLDNDDKQLLENIKIEISGKAAHKMYKNNSRNYSKI